MVMPFFFRISTVIMLMILVIALSGCQYIDGVNDGLDTQRVEKYSPERKSPILLEITRVEVANLYRSPNTQPYVDHLFDVPPKDALQLWVSKNLHAQGEQRVLRFEIHDASVREESFVGEQRMMGFLEGKRMTRYTAKIKAVLKLYGPRSLLPEAQIEVQSGFSDAIATASKPEAHQRLFRQITRQVMTQFDEAARERIAEYFSNYIIAGAALPKDTADDSVLPASLE